jgi:hypothetical protein
MGWRDLLEKQEGTTLVSPWTGGRSLYQGDRKWDITGDLPREHGWFSFRLAGRKASVEKESEPNSESLTQVVRGYLVGDRLVLSTASVSPDPAQIASHSERVYLIEPGLERFAHVSAGRVCEGGHLVYRGQEMPLGPEESVLQAYQDQKASVVEIPEVTPALDAAFRMETWHRSEVERRRAEVEKQRLEEETRRQQAERRAQLLEKLGDAVGRRQMAQTDFGEAARAALAMGGAVYLDHRKAFGRNEMVVTYRLMNRRFEATCDATTLRIIDAGICLTDHDTREKGDGYFTLESIPSVVRQADQEGKLVVYRHGGEDYDDD